MFTSYFFIGDGLRKLASDTCRYVRKNAGSKADHSFCGFSWIEDEHGDLDVVRMASATSKTLAFAPDLSGEYEVTPIDVDMKQLGADAWGSFFKNLYQQHVNIAGLHDKMYVCFILAGHDARGVDTVRQLTSCVNRIKNANFIADVMVLAPELARLTEEKWRETIDPFSLPYKSFKPVEILGYPHAGNDVFHAKGMFEGKEVRAYIKAARQKGAAIDETTQKACDYYRELVGSGRAKLSE